MEVAKFQKLNNLDWSEAGSFGRFWDFYKRHQQTVNAVPSCALSFLLCHGFSLYNLFFDRRFVNFMSTSDFNIFNILTALLQGLAARHRWTGSSGPGAIKLPIDPSRAFRGEDVGNPISSRVAGFFSRADFYAWRSPKPHRFSWQSWQGSNPKQAHNLFGRGYCGECWSEHVRVWEESIKRAQSCVWWISAVSTLCRIGLEQFQGSERSVKSIKSAGILGQCGESFVSSLWCEHVCRFWTKGRSLQRVPWKIRAEFGRGAWRWWSLPNNHEVLETVPVRFTTASGQTFSGFLRERASKSHGPGIADSTKGCESRFKSAGAPSTTGYMWLGYWRTTACTSKMFVRWAQGGSCNESCWSYWASPSFDWPSWSTSWVEQEISTLGESRWFFGIQWDTSLGSWWTPSPASDRSPLWAVGSADGRLLFHSTSGFDEQRSSEDCRKHHIKIARRWKASSSVSEKQGIVDGFEQGRQDVHDLINLQA